ncbi:elongator complex protein 2 [Rhizoctonia solani AG-1 IB]|uniref:Elongator complex protein 2 n=1 Tax=Thanatephorus cucumeris (strain AG1-IB / isolate 7/3/14) TaxID=1108050 RepID=A0A0B7G4Z3_THACB|nr:elongator complex protein 2 [Rhizoctonia solani AG-1 IB]
MSLATDSDAFAYHCDYITSANIWWVYWKLLVIYGAPAVGGEGFRQAQQLLVDSPIITAGGYAAAIPAWKEMHKEPQRLPEALKCYGQDQATLFVKFYNKSFPLVKKHDDNYLSRDWFDPEVHLEVRKVFENFGLALDDHDLECFRRMGLAARMYARLPLWDPKLGVEDDKEGLGIHHNNYFYCRAALPARPIAAQWSRVSSLISTTGAGVEFLEYLLDRCKPMWTQNTESLRANWYHTNRGTQQVVADWLAPGNYPDGYIASRLNKASAIQWIENPFTYLALRYVDKAVDPKHRLSMLRLDYGAGRTDGLKALKPEKLDEIRIFKEGVPKTGCANVGKLAQTLKEFAKTSLIPFIQDGQAQDLEALLEANPCTRIISPVFWRTVQPISYATSWSIADHNQIIPGTIIGWGLALDAYHTLVVDHLLYHRCVYWLFDLAKVSSKDRTKDSVPSDTENETDSDWDATAEMEPITGIGNPILHVTQPGTRGRVPPSSLISIPPSHTTDHQRFLGRKKRAKKPRLSQKPQKTLQDSLTVAHCSQGPHTQSSRRIASGSISDQGSLAQVPSPLQEDAHEDILSNNPPPSPGLPQDAMDTEQPRDTQEPSHSLLWPNQSPLYPSAWSVSAIQSPHARSPQLPSVSATNSGNLLPSNKPSPFTSLVPENAHVLVGATQSSVAETDTPIDVIGCWAVWQTDGTRRWNEKQFTFDHLDSEAVARAFPNWQLTENQEEIMREMSVSGILVNGFLSSRLFPGLDGQLFFGPVRQRADVVRKADKAKTRTLMALDGIHHLQRRMLNNLLVNIPRLVCESTYPSSYVHDNLAVHIYHTKLSYLKMVAASIHKAQIPLDDAWAEAVFLAVSDKVFANEGFEWHESGELVMDVSWVFAGGVTNHPNAGKVVVLIVPHPVAPLDRLWSTYDRYLATAVAQGPSLSAAMSHAIMAGPVQALQTYGFVEGRVIRPNGPVSTAALPVIDNVDFDQGPQFRRVVYSRRTGYPSEEEHSVAFDYGMRQVEVKTLPRTLQSLCSCFSDGRFLRELPWMFLSYSGKGSSEPELLPHFYRAEQELLKKRTELSSALEKYYSELVFSLAKSKVAASWDSICGNGADSHTTNLVLVPDSITGPTTSTPVATHLLPPNTSDQVDQILPKMNLAGLAAINAVSPLGFRRPTTETGRFQNTDRRFLVPSRTLSPPTIHAGQSQRHTSGVGPSSLLWSTSLQSMLTRSPPPTSQVIIDDNQRNKRKLTISSSSPTKGKTRCRLDDCNYDDDDDGDGDDEAFN